MAEVAAKVASEKLVALYARFRAELDAMPVGGRWMPYRWWKLPDRLSAVWMAFGQMLDEYASELANIINDLTHHVHRLRAWHNVVEKLSDEDKLRSTHEFIDMLGTVALGLPYAIKSRFAVAAGQLCHQVNQAKDLDGWKDNFPNGNLYLNHIEPYCKDWGRYRPLMLAVEPIAGKSFREASANFRHAYNHGFSSHFVIGISGSVERLEADDGTISYGFGGKGPLTLAHVADVLEIERDHCYRAFERLQDLIAELIAAIEEFDAKHLPNKPA
jgi:hypothetical protein